MSTDSIITSKALGQRVAKARCAAGLTQSELAQRIRLDRTAISRIESGDRRLEALELVAISRSTGVPAEWLLQSVPIVASYRGRPEEDQLGVRVEALIATLERDLTLLLDLAALKAPQNLRELQTPRSPDEAETAATRLRERMGWGDGPIADLLRVSETVGLYSIVEDLGPDLPEGIYRPVASVGIAWINGRAPTGRRRFTLAHELGHHVFQDEYAVDWPETGDEGTERIINAFAVHLLLPRMGLKRRWEELANDYAEPRDRAILIAAEFGASWSATLAQLRRIGLLSLPEQNAFLQEQPRRGDYVGLATAFPEDISAPRLSPRLAAAVVAAYRRGGISQTRALELLRGTIAADEFPEPATLPLAAFAGDLR